MKSGFGMFGWGYFQGWLYAWLRSRQLDRDAVLTYAVTVLHFGPTTLMVGEAIGYVLPVLATLWFIRMRSAARSFALPRRVATGALCGACGARSG